MSALLVVGCVREETVAGHRPGDRVEFGVSTGYDNAPETKAPEGMAALGDDNLPESVCGLAEGMAAPGDDNLPEGVCGLAEGMAALGDDNLPEGVYGLAEGMAASASGNDMAGKGAAGSVGSPGSGNEGGVPQTRTAYSGQDFTVGSSKWERIDWVDGDLFSVHCAEAQGTLKKADYKVVAHSASNEKSLADIAPATGQSLVWGTGEHVFYAMYPAASTPGVDVSKVSLNGNVLKGTIPAAQAVTRKPGSWPTWTFMPDMRYAYMYAATTVPASGAPGPVNLRFKPMMTALEFTVDSGDDPTLFLYSFELSSTDVALTGDFTATVTAATGEDAACSYAVPSRTEANSKISVDFGGAAHPTFINKGYPITFTVFALPQDLTGLTAKFVTSKGDRTLALSYAGGSSVNFLSCRKSRIATLGVPGMYDFHLVVTDPGTVPYTGGTTSATVWSYKTRRSDNALLPVPWRVAGYYAEPSCYWPYYDDGNMDATRKPEWLKFDLYSGPGSGVTEQRSIRIGATPDYYTWMPYANATVEAANLPLKRAAEVGTPSACWNLANPSDGGDLIVESANCYIINAPGYYRIPLVMGNGVRNGADNTAAYTAENFKDYKDANIASPYLHKTSSGAGVPTGAHVVWSEGRYIDVTAWDWDIAPVGGAPSPITTTGSGESLVYWLNFHVRWDHIRQGNAIVAVTDADGTVMWSWHLWLTDYVPNNYPAYASSPDKDIPVTNHGGYVYTFMPRNLGWTINGCTENSNYEVREVYVKFVQDGGDAPAAVMKVLQTGGTQVVTIIPTGDHSPFYQFGRKDPMMPSDGTSSNQTLSPLFGRITAFQNVNARQTVGGAIRNPGTNYGYNYTEPRDWCVDTDRKNWWSAGNTATTFNDDPVVKTVYDPCPAGYRLPASNAFTRFTITGGNSWTQSEFNVKDMDGDGAVTSADFQNGWHFYTDASRTRTIFFPAEGHRGASLGTLFYGTVTGNYAAATPVDMNVGCFLHFSVGAVIPQAHAHRADGIAIRPVQDVPVVSPGIGAGISTGGQKSNDVTPNAGWY